MQESLLYPGPMERSPASRGRVEQQLCTAGEGEEGRSYTTSHTKTSLSPSNNNQSTLMLRNEKKEKLSDI